MTNAAARDAGSEPAPRGLDAAGAGGAAPERPEEAPLSDVALGLAVVAQRRASGVAAAMVMPVEAAGSLVMRLTTVALDVTGLGARAHALARRGRATRHRNRQAATEALRRLLRAVIAFAVDEADVDEIVARVDLDAVLSRIEVAELVQRVLDEVDVGRIVRESSSGLAAETVDAVRAQTMRADGALNRVVDRVLLRRSARVTGLGPDPDTRSGVGP